MLLLGIEKKECFMIFVSHFDFNKFGSYSILCVLQFYMLITGVQLEKNF